MVVKECQGHLASHEKQPLVQLPCLFALLLLRVQCIILFGKRSHEGGKIYCLFVYCSYSSNSHGNSGGVGGGGSSNRSSNICSNKMMREK